MDFSKSVRQSTTPRRNKDTGVVRPTTVRSAPTSFPLIQRKAECACGGGCPRCKAQTALTVNQPGDVAEIEADQIADKVMRMPDLFPSDRQLSFSFFGASTAQRNYLTYGKEEKLQRKNNKNSGDLPSSTPPIVREAINTTGQQLDPATLGFFEARFGQDFSDVQIHSGTKGAESAESLNALAYTFENHIVFNEGQYEPNTVKGKRLIAHELVHVVQQSDLSSTNVVLRKPKEDDDTKYPIDYKSATEANLVNWYDRYKFINLFVNVYYKKNKGIFPGSNPIAYANQVFELQQTLKLSFTKETVKTNGILDDLTINLTLTLAVYKKNNPSAAISISQSILDRVLHIQEKQIENPKVLHSTFGTFKQFEMVSKNKAFVVSKGDSGKHVTFLQRALLNWGYLVLEEQVTGYYGEDTESAVRTFQADAGMDSIDGNVGFGTLHLMDLKWISYASVVRTPGTVSYRQGNLSEELKIWIDGDGDQKKELQLLFRRNGERLSVKVKHADTGEIRGPFLFVASPLDLKKELMIMQTDPTEGLRHTEISLANVDKMEDVFKLLLYPPNAIGGGDYRLNNEKFQFDAIKTRPHETAKYEKETSLQGLPAITAILGPFDDHFRVYFDLTEEIKQEPPYEANLNVLGISEKNIVYKDPLKVNLTSPNRAIKVLDNTLTSLVLDLDGDEVADITLYSRVVQRSFDKPARELHNILIRFSGNALTKDEELGFGVRNGAYIIEIDRSVEGFKKYTSGLGPLHLADTKAPEDANVEIVAIDQTLIQYYLKALREDVIKGDTLAAWWETEHSLKFIMENFIGKSSYTPEEESLISKAAEAADKYQRLIQRDAGDRRTSKNIAATETSSTDVTENPYTKESVMTTIAPFVTQENKTEVKLGEDIRVKNWSKARQSGAELEDGFNQWVGDRLQEKLPGDKDIGRYVKGISAMRLGLHNLSHNANVKHLTRLKAIYYSSEQYLKTARDETPPRIDLPLYYYYDVQEEKWCIVDYIQTKNPYRSTFEGDGNVAYPPKEAFEKELNSKRHLPKGVLWYNHPDGTFNGKVDLTEPWEWSEILGWVSAGLAGLGLAGLIVFSGGAATPLAVEIIFAASAVAGVASAGLDISENAQHGTLTSTSLLLDIGAIAANLLMLGAIAGKITVGVASKAAQSSIPWAGGIAKVAAMADASYIPLTAASIGVDGFNVAILTADSLSKLNEIENGSGDEASKQKAKILLLSNLIANGGLFVLSVKGNMSALAGEKNIHLYVGRNGATVALDSQTFQFLKDFNEKVPAEFATAMYILGKDEIKFVNAFAHDMTGRGDFYQLIEDYLKNHNKYKLTKDEAFAIWGYTSKFYYADLNRMLREGVNPDLTGPMSELLSSALKKLPDYSEKYAYRGIKIAPDELAAFKAKNQVGATLEWGDFTSAGGSREASFDVKGNRNVVFEIEQKSAKDISLLADAIKFGGMEKPELLFDKSLNVTITAVAESGSKLVIKVREN